MIAMNFIAGHVTTHFEEKNLSLIGVMEMAQELSTPLGMSTNAVDAEILGK